MLLSLMLKGSTVTAPFGGAIGIYDAAACAPELASSATEISALAPNKVFRMDFLPPLIERLIITGEIRNCAKKTSAAHIAARRGLSGEQLQCSLVNACVTGGNN